MKMVLKVDISGNKEKRREGLKFKKKVPKHGKFWKDAPLALASGALRRF
jgi:hypothetical protein